MNNKNQSSKTSDSNPANRDPITGEPGAHPVSTGTGAAAGGIAGAAVGSLAGPVGTAIGAAAGAVAGGYAGKAAGEAIDPTEQDTYWRENYQTRSYSKDFKSYDEVAPAYKYGWECATKNKGKRFSEVEPNISQGWDRAKGKSSLTWDRAKNAVKDAWDRVTPGGSK
jgi:phage tail tape-measure protein